MLRPPPALFCGSKKSFIHGTAMANVLFSNNISLGMILLPLMLYHALQLVIVSVIAQAMQKADRWTRSPDTILRK